MAIITAFSSQLGNLTHFMQSPHILWGRESLLMTLNLSLLKKAVLYVSAKPFFKPSELASSRHAVTSFVPMPALVCPSLTASDLISPMSDEHMCRAHVPRILPPDSYTKKSRRLSHMSVSDLCSIMPFLANASTIEYMA